MAAVSIIKLQLRIMEIKANYHTLSK